MASNFEFMNLPLQIKPTFKGSLEKDVTFESMNEANAWLGSAYAYEGAAVRIKEDGTWYFYLVQNRDNVLVFEKIEGSGGSDYPYDHALDNVDELTDPNFTDSEHIIDKVNEILRAMKGVNPASNIHELGYDKELGQVTIEDIYDKVNEIIRELKNPTE